ncbi:transposase [Paraburkholderia diazotrophica]|uniref:transposase n=1 Tax=Paraburkholderia diazotrophica TaxID=667676 RepID=UPI003898D743
MVVAQSNDPARSIADVAQEHGLNANMIARWRRAHERAQSTTQAQPAETFIPVHACAGATDVEYRRRVRRRASPLRWTT